MESAELIAILHEVRDRARGRTPQTSAGADIPLPDLLPLLHARDAALGKVAAIGTVNPRSGGIVNSIVQTWKRLVARVLDWHVREQVEFNRKIVAYADAVLEEQREANRALAEMGSRLAAGLADMHHAVNEVKDLRDRWADWHVQWERTLQNNEATFLRNTADLQGGFQHRVTLMEASHRDLMRVHNDDFHAALERHGHEIQKRLWADLEQIRLDTAKIIHAELRTVRQRAQISSLSAPAPAAPAPVPATAAAPATLGFDYGQFAERFRGPEEYVKAGQEFYAPYFQGCHDVLDIGCGRGEFLKRMRDLGVPARGIELGPESVATCKAAGLDVELADAYTYLADLPEGSLDGIFCSQVVEHLPPERLPEFLRLCCSRLRPNGVIALETPNPECLAIFATHFYLDPTHTRPVPHPLLVFYLQEFGVGNIEVHGLSPARLSMPSINSLPEDFREAFFGPLDYAAIGRKL